MGTLQMILAWTVMAGWLTPEQADEVYGSLHGRAVPKTPSETFRVLMGEINRVRGFDVRQG
jgi:hypothetical protein